VSRDGNEPYTSLKGHLHSEIFLSLAINMPNDSYVIRQVYYCLSRRSLMYLHSFLRTCSSIEPCSYENETRNFHGTAYHTSAILKHTHHNSKICIPVGAGECLFGDRLAISKRKLQPTGRIGEPNGGRVCPPGWPSVAQNWLRMCRAGTARPLSFLCSGHVYSH
jgi:hypothetical protein